MTALVGVGLGEVGNCGQHRGERRIMLDGRQKASVGILVWWVRRQPTLEGLPSAPELWHTEAVRVLPVAQLTHSTRSRALGLGATFVAGRSAAQLSLLTKQKTLYTAQLSNMVLFGTLALALNGKMKAGGGEVGCMSGQGWREWRQGKNKIRTRRV